MGKKGQINFFKTVCIATFSPWQKGKRLPTNGMIEPLLGFFSKRAGKIILIDCPHPGSSDDVVPKIETFIRGKLTEQKAPKFLFPSKKTLEKNNTLATQPVFKLRDVVTDFQVLWEQKEKLDLFIGLESIHTLVGIIFKKLGKIKTVVYYVSDYSPNRYKSKVFNSIYLWLDRFCATNADYIWDVSPAMLPARIKAGIDFKKIKPVIDVPNALFPFQIDYNPISKLKRNSLLFVGTIGPENGLDLAIEALAIVKKTIPSTTLDVLGSGLETEERKVKEMVKELKLEKSVKFHGFVSSLEKLSKISKQFMVGLAPYRAIKTSVRWYADATKMRLYFANGLPVVTTQVPPLGKEAEKKVSAIVTIDKPEEYSQAIIKMLRNKKIYEKYRKNAIEFAKENTWENTYKNALKQMSFNSN